MQDPFDALLGFVILWVRLGCTPRLQLYPAPNLRTMHVQHFTSCHRIFLSDASTTLHRTEHFQISPCFLCIYLLHCPSLISLPLKLSISSQNGHRSHCAI